MPSARDTSPIDGALSTTSPGSRTSGAAPSAGASSRQEKGNRLLRANSSIRIVAGDERGPTIARPSPSIVCSASRLAMKVDSTRSLSGPSSKSSARIASRSTAM